MTGRPSLFTEEIAETICARLADGESLISICLDDDMPGSRTVLRWADENEAFGSKYARAREAQAEFMDHKIITTADNITDPAVARVQIDAYKWRASKLAPKRYGDKLDLTSNGESMAPNREPRYGLVDGDRTEN